MASPVYGTNIPTAKPQKRTVDVRSLSIAMAGAEPPYPVYEFSYGRVKVEFRGHNPFLHTPPYY